MRVDDLWKFSACNMDPLTETYSYSFYCDYIIKWPMLCRVLEGPTGKIEAYSKQNLLVSLVEPQKSIARSISRKKVEKRFISHTVLMIRKGVLFDAN